MPDETDMEVAALYRYPVKGLSAEPLDAVTLEAGGAFPWDRAYAIENGPSGFDAAAPQKLPKTKFLTLAQNARLAKLESRFDPATRMLTLARGAKPVVSGRLDDPVGRRLIEQFFAGFMADELRGPPRVLPGNGHTFADVGLKVVSIINLATLRALAPVAGGPLHPLRFRANLYVEAAPYAELGWVGRRLEGADGLALEGVKRIVRCAATNVNPETAERDRTLPRTLLETFGHADCGIYAHVAAGGTLRIGDRLRLV
jgi:uncharacterized protein YcbX